MPLFDPQNWVQSQSTELSVDTTTTSGTFVDLLTVTIESTGGDILCSVSSGASNSGANNGIYFRVTLDGVAGRGAASRYINLPSVAVAIQDRFTSVPPGSHTVKLQWRVDGGTGRIRPATVPDAEHATLRIIEALT